MSDNQKYSILSNDLVRRLSNINRDKITLEEMLSVIERFIQMLVTSGYDRKQSREVVVSGLRGWKSKIRRREENKQEFYRSAVSTLAGRYKKKLTARTSWFKTGSKKREYEMD